MQDVTRLRYHPFEGLPVLRPVDRIDYIKQQVRGLRVLDIGAYDETEVDEKQHKSWRWLHAEIASSAKEVLGVDGSEKLRASGGVTTPVGTRVLYGKVDNLDDIVKSFRPDIIVAGELIEHTPDTLGWLGRLGELLPGVRLLATTPNATAIVNLLLAFAGRENNPAEHIQIYSYKTLATLARLLGMTHVTIRPFYYHSHLFRRRVSSIVTPLVYLADYAFLTPIQYLFPLTAGGLILEGNLGQQNERPQS